MVGPQHVEPEAESGWHKEWLALALRPKHGLAGGRTGEHGPSFNADSVCWYRAGLELVDWCAVATVRVD
jgi:hypothetical protein